MPNPYAQPQQRRRVVTQNALGQSGSSTYHRNAALKVVGYWRVQVRELPLEETYTEIEGENLEVLINWLCNWLSSTPIPRYAKDDLTPSNPSNKQCCTTTTLVSYVGQYLVYLRTKFPQHEDFVGLNKESDVPTFWSALREAFTAECNRFHLSSTDFTFGTDEIVPIYTIVNYDGSDPDEYKKCDLQRVMRNMVKSARTANALMEWRAIIGTTFDASGRGGEARFLNFVDHRYDYKLKVIDTMWAQSKTTNKKKIEMSSMVRIPDPLWEFDHYHQMAGYGLAGGFFRTDEQKQNGVGNVVFPSLHSLKAESVTGKVTAKLRAMLPAEISIKTRKSFSAKSLRRGAITELATHPSLSVLQICFLTGHSTGTCLESYFDNRNPLRTLPAMKALHGEPDIYGDNILPRLESLGEANRVAVERLIGKMFQITIPSLMKGGRLREYVNVMAADAIWHHSHVTRDCGAASWMCVMMRKAARDAEITDIRFPGLSSETLLMEWSRMMDDDYKDQARRQAPSQSFGNSHDAAYQVLTQVAQDTREINNDRSELLLTIATLKSSLSSLENENRYLRDEYDKMNRKLAFIRTPPSEGRKRQRESSPEGRSADDPITADPPTPPPGADGDANAPSLVPMSMSQEAQESQDLEDHLMESVAAHPIRNIEDELRHQNIMYHHIEQDAKRLYDALIKLAEQGLINEDDWSKTKVPRNGVLKEPNLLEYCLELCQYVAECDDGDFKTHMKTVFEYKKHENDVVQTAALAIESACYSKMLQLEGTTVEAYKRTSKSTAGPKRSKKYATLGQHVRSYKQEVCKARSNKTAVKNNDVAATKIVAYEELQRLKRLNAPGTPEDNRSITNFMTAPRRGATTVPRQSATTVAAAAQEADLDDDAAAGIGDFGI